MLYIISGSSLRWVFSLNHERIKAYLSSKNGPSYGFRLKKHSILLIFKRIISESIL